MYTVGSEVNLSLGTGGRSDSHGLMSVAICVVLNEVLSQY